jgi:hypothetical protein
MTKKTSVKLDGEKSDVFYVQLPLHSGREAVGIVSKTVRLRELFLELERPDLLISMGETDVLLDYGHDGVMIGIEILT